MHDPWNCIVETPPDVIAVTETWSKNELKDAKLSTQGYKFCRKDRSDYRFDNGALLMIHDNIAKRSETISRLNLSSFGPTLSPFHIGQE